MEALSGGFRQRLYQLRTDRGWSQSDLARAVWGVVTDKEGRPAAKNRDRISAYEAGRALPTRQNLDAIAKVLGLPVADLAPDLVMSSRGVAASEAAFEFKMVSGTAVPTAHLKLNAILPLGVASQILGLLNTLPEIKPGGELG